MADDGRPTAAPAGAILARCRYGPTTAAGWGDGETAVSNSTLELPHERITDRAARQSEI